MNKIELGRMNRLTVVKAVDFGLYLDGGREGEILLPSRCALLLRQNILKLWSVILPTFRLPG